MQIDVLNLNYFLSYILQHLHCQINLILLIVHFVSSRRLFENALVILNNDKIRRRLALAIPNEHPKTRLTAKVFHKSGEVKEKGFLNERKIQLLNLNLNQTVTQGGY